MTNTKATTQAKVTTAISRFWQPAFGVLLACAGISCLLGQAPVVESSTNSSARVQEVRADILKRPAWPYAWMQLAVLLADQGQYGDALSEALGRTLQLGSGESALEYQRAMLALEHRQAPLPHAAAAILNHSLLLERKRHPTLIQAYVVMNHQDRSYCGIQDLTPQEQQWCVYLSNMRQRCRDRLFDRDAEATCSEMERHYAPMLSNWRFWVTTSHGEP